MIQIGQLLKKEGIDYLDATVGGSSEQAKNQEVILMIGGASEAFQQCNDLWECWSKQFYYLGPTGSGAKMKLVMNLILGLNRAVLAEGLSFAKAMELPLEKTLEILKVSPASSEVMKTKGTKMISQDFTPPQARLKQHLKDVRLIIESARNLSQAVPLSELHESILEELSQSGFGDEDNSAVIRFFEKD